METHKTKHVVYPAQAAELAKLLQEDQNEWREFARKEFEASEKSSLSHEKHILRQRVKTRANRTLEILAEIGEPSISNIGENGALAISILATHDSLAATRQVLAAFNDLFEQDKANTHYTSIPAMTDWVLVLERKHQEFGTIWLMDKNNEPFLPIVDNFDHVNERRAEYGIEPLRWPKSLAIPESKQPWLSRPIQTLVMREPTDKEYSEFIGDYLE